MAQEVFGPGAHAGIVLQRGIEPLEIFFSGYRVGSETFQMAVVQLAINELESSGLGVLVQRPEGEFGGVGGGREHRLTEKHIA